MSVTKLIIDVIEKGEMMDEEEFEKACKAAGLDDSRMETCKAIHKLAGVHKDDAAVMDFMKAHLQKLFGKPDPKEDKEQQMADAEAKKAEELAKAEAEKAAKAAADAAAAKATDDKKGEDVMKAEVERQVAAKLEAITKSQESVIKSLQEQVQKQADANRKAEWIRKAEKELAFVPGQSSDELGTMLFDLEKASEASAKSTFETLKKTSESMKAITKQRGYTGETQFKGSGAGADDTFQQIMKSATEDKEAMAGATEVVKNFAGVKEVAPGSLNGRVMSKGEQVRKAAEYQAVSDFILAHPEMYDQYLAEHPEQTRGNHRGN